MNETSSVVDVVPGFRLYLAASPAGLRYILFTEPSDALPGVKDSTPLIEETVSQLRAYFAGKLQTFDLPLDLRGTPFQKRVWAALLTIPYGQTRSYAEVARQVQAPDAVRAVGTANGSNPISIVVPCHRVINTGGKLGGYGGGLERKRALLDLEAGRASLFG